MTTLPSLLIGSLLGAIFTSFCTYVVQNLLLKKQHEFQRKLAEDQTKFQEAMFQKQTALQDRLAMEQRNFHNTGIHSLRKIGGG